MKRINWQNIQLIAIIALMGFLYIFSSYKNKNRNIQDIKVQFQEDQNPFLNEKMVNNLLIQNWNGVVNVPKNKVDLNTLEKLLNANKYVENSEISCAINGDINVFVTPKKPIVRVINSTASYYLDNKGDRFPLSDNFSARVPVFYGTITPKNNEKITEMYNLINEDTILKQNIVDGKQLTNGNFVFSVRNYGFDLLFGKAENIEEKFKNYKVFLQFSSKKTIINNYKTVSLLYDNQVVCSN